MYEQKTIPKWIKNLDKSNSIKILDFAVSHPNIVSTPYSKEIPKEEFLQICLYLLSLFCSKFTFKESPISTWEEISSFLGLSIKQTKLLQEEQGLPVATVGQRPYSTKERLTVWQNHFIESSILKNTKNKFKKTNKTDIITRIYEIQRLREEYSLEEDFDFSVIEFLDDQIFKLKEELKKKDKAKEKKEDKL